MSGDTGDIGCAECRNWCAMLSANGLKAGNGCYCGACGALESEIQRRQDFCEVFEAMMLIPEGTEV